jgi:hypothetical protein
MHNMQVQVVYASTAELSPKLRHLSGEPGSTHKAPTSWGAASTHTHCGCTCSCRHAGSWHPANTNRNIQGDACNSLPADHQKTKLLFTMLHTLLSITRVSASCLWYSADTDAPNLAQLQTHNQTVSHWLSRHHSCLQPHLLVKRARQRLIAVHPWVSAPCLFIGVHKWAQRPVYTKTETHSQDLCGDTCSADRHIYNHQQHPAHRTPCLPIVCIRGCTWHNLQGQIMQQQLLSVWDHPALLPQLGP